MSIYTTLWELQFPILGDQDEDTWVKITAQGVPAFIGTPTPGHGYDSRDPYAHFLPPAVSVDDDQAPALRAVVIIREGAQKVGQEYVAPLVVISGTEYASISFDVLHQRICEALGSES